MKSAIATILFCVASMLCVAGSETDIGKRALPTLSIKEAIDVAEAYLKETNISKDSHFLARVDYHEFGSLTEPNPSTKTSGSYWQVTYELKERADGGQIFIMVYMDRSIGHVRGR